MAPGLFSEVEIMNYLLKMAPGPVCENYQLAIASTMHGLNQGGLAIWRCLQPEETCFYGRNLKGMTRIRMFQESVLPEGLITSTIQVQNPMFFHFPLLFNKETL